ncbi:hypothetical protein [Starkeya nomas]|uniref:hypothetical protein n=1 Tax=Starkeya nomas TaxID=2666134 RepID=UPI00135B33CC|nr:hypothetical protein [Starkeya nomas]
MNDVGFYIENGCRLSHGRSSNIKQPFSFVDLTMNELSIPRVMVRRSLVDSSALFRSPPIIGSPGTSMLLIWKTARRS